MAVYTDDFNRADESPFSSAGNWGVTTGSSFDGVLLSQKVSYNGDGDDFELYWKNSTAGADQYSQAKILLLGNTDDESGPGVLLRHIGTSTRTFIRAVVSTSSTGKVYIRKCTAGVSVLLGSVSAGSWANGDVMRAEVEGVSPNITIRIYKNGSLAGSLTGQTAADSGKPGIAYSSLPSNAEWDDWEGGDLVTVPAVKLFIPRRMPQGV